MGYLHCFGENLFFWQGLLRNEMFPSKRRGFERKRKDPMQDDWREKTNTSTGSKVTK